MKTFEVCIKEINHGYVIVNAENPKKAVGVALRKYHRDIAVMGDEPEVEAGTVKEISPMGFQTNS